MKTYHSDYFNYTFDKSTGKTVTWGKDYDDDPDVAPFPMILDMEITTKCHGIGTKYGRNKDSKLESNPCSFCYNSLLPSL